MSSQDPFDSIEFSTTLLPSSFKTRIIPTYKPRNNLVWKLDIIEKPIQTQTVSTDTSGFGRIHFSSALSSNSTDYKFYGWKLNIRYEGPVDLHLRDILTANIQYQQFWYDWAALRDQGKDNEDLVNQAQRALEKRSDYPKSNSEYAWHSLRRFAECDWWWENKMYTQEREKIHINLTIDQFIDYMNKRLEHVDNLVDERVSDMNHRSPYQVGLAPQNLTASGALFLPQAGLELKRRRLGALTSTDQLDDTLDSRGVLDSKIKKGI